MEVLSTGWFKGLSSIKLYFLNNHDSTFSAIDENWMILDVKFHEKYDKTSFVEKSCFANGKKQD